MKRRTFLAATAAATLPTRLSAQASPNRIRLGVIGISFHTVVGAVAQHVLEGLGATVEVSSAPHDVMFQRLGADEIDLLVTAWMPGTHRHLFEPIRDRIEPVSTVYRDARLYWAVPAFVPPAMVSSVDDLLRPDVAARMEKTIRSIGPSAGLSVRSLRMVPEYGLGSAGYHVQPGETADWLRHFREAYAEGRWVVMPLWQPHFLNRTHEVRVLREPKGVMGEADDAVIVASRPFLNRASTLALRTLRAMEIGLDGVTEMDLAVNVRNLTPKQAAAAWLAAHADRVSRWQA